jgi:hypothetical protein
MTLFSPKDRGSKCIVFRSIERVMLAVKWFYLTLLILLVLASCTPAQQPDTKHLQSKPPIGKQEFLRQFMDKKANKKAISNRSIPAEAIIETLRWAQDEVTAGRAANLPDRLSITDSVIIGNLDFKKLRQTPLDELPEDLQKKYKYGRPEKVVVIPLGIEINKSILHGNDFRKVVFSEFVSFSDSTFEYGADFEESLFESAVSFEGTIFKGDASFEASIFDYPDEIVFFDKTQFLGRANFIVPIGEG